jgi:hypothetical protein
MGTVKHADNYAKAWLPAQEILLGMLSAHDPSWEYTTLSGVTGTTATASTASTIASNYTTISSGTGTTATTTTASTIASNYTTLSSGTGTTATTTAASTIASTYCMADGAPWYSPSRSVEVILKPCP